VTALYVKIDGSLVKDRRPGRPARLSQPELVCLAVAQALLGFHSEHRWIRFAICHLRSCFPYLPHQPGYNKRLRAALPVIKQVIRDLAADSDFWQDNVWIAASTPVECARSRPAVKRPDMAGWANYGYCASHSRWFWGLRLYLICTPAGMPVLQALADPKIGEREVLAAMPGVEPQLATARPGLALITDKGFAGRETEADLAARGITLLRPSRKDEGRPPRRAAAQVHPPAHRIGQRHPQRPARPRSPRRTHLRGRRHPGRPAHPGHGRRDLAQQQDRRPGHPVADRLRPLKPYGITRLGEQGQPGLLAAGDADVSQFPASVEVAFPRHCGSAQ
jgi:hypothetical protein